MNSEEIAALIIAIIGLLDLIINILNRQRLKKVKKDIETQTETTEETLIENAIEKYLKDKEK